MQSQRRGARSVNAVGGDRGGPRTRRCACSAAGFGIRRETERMGEAEKDQAGEEEEKRCGVGCKTDKTETVFGDRAFGGGCASEGIELDLHLDVGRLVGHGDARQTGGVHQSQRDGVRRMHPQHNGCVGNTFALESSRQRRARRMLLTYLDALTHQSTAS
jgi:hypothetical protein